MGRIIYLPFENLPQRYTKMWNDAIEKNLAPSDISVRVDTAETIIRKGEFLDIYGTNIYKQRQLQAVGEMFQQGEIRDGDTFYIPDIFYPGMESIRYMADLSGLHIRIVAFNHAGRADLDDFVQKLGPWSDTQEYAWHQMCDLVMVGSEYQARRVRAKFPGVPVVVTGAVWDKEWMEGMTRNLPGGPKEEYIIWPHRPCLEKNYPLFLEIARDNPELRFVITSGGPSRLDRATLPANVEYRPGLTKQEYFDIFSRAKYFLSTALQETFGYTIQEAIYFGAKVICPDYACYREYADQDSIVPFERMRGPGVLSEIIRTRDLSRCRQFPDNAKTILNLIR